MITSRQENIQNYSASIKTRAYVELLKPRLSMLVAFSCAFGYGLATHGAVNWFTLTILTLAVFFLSGASVAINQVIEKDYDKLMERTKNRPLPTGKLSVSEALFFAAICSIVSLTLLSFYTNTLTVILSIVSMLLYCFAYTPLKRVG